MIFKSHAHFLQFSRIQKIGKKLNYNQFLALLVAVIMLPHSFKSGRGKYFFQNQSIIALLLRFFLLAGFHYCLFNVFLFVMMMISL